MAASAGQLHLPGNRKTFLYMPVLADRLSLAFGFAFEDLYHREGLARLDSRFLDYLKAADAPLLDRLLAARFDPPSEVRKQQSEQARKQQSELLLDLAPHLEDFIGELFGI